MKTQTRLAELLESAGIQIDGERAWDIEVKDDRFFSRVRRGGLVGLGESYMDGWWDCQSLDELAYRAFSTGFARSSMIDRATRLFKLKSRILNLQRGKRSSKVAHAHYNLGNAFFERMLGLTMVYSCAHWAQAQTLDDAQDAKLDLLCQSLDLEAGHRVLDVGCGWGAFARHAATRYGCKVVGISNSSEQCEYARTLCEDLPVQVRLLDYRDPRLADLGTFDRIVSVGMFEHVGTKNYGRYIGIIRRLLAKDGCFLLQTIGTHSLYTVDPWFDRYIFPNSAVPRPSQVVHAIEGHFLIQEWNNAGRDYDPTVMAWYQNLCTGAEDQEPWDDPRFRRMWTYYLLCAAGNFRSQCAWQVWRILLTPERG